MNEEIEKGRIRISKSFETNEREREKWLDNVDEAVKLKKERKSNLD